MIVLTNRQEVEARTGRALTPDEDAIFDALARDISALLYAVAPKIPNTLPIPDAVLGVAANLAISGLEAGTAASTSGIAGESLGGYAIQYSSSGGQDAGGLNLTTPMWQALRPWRRSGIGSVLIDPSTAVAM